MEFYHNGKPLVSDSGSAFSYKIKEFGEATSKKGNQYPVIVLEDKLGQEFKKAVFADVKGGKNLIDAIGEVFGFDKDARVDTNDLVGKFIEIESEKPEGAEYYEIVSVKKCEPFKTSEDDLPF